MNRLHAVSATLMAVVLFATPALSQNSKAVFDGCYIIANTQGLPEVPAERHEQTLMCFMTINNYLDRGFDLRICPEVRSIRHLARHVVEFVQRFPAARNRHYSDLILEAMRGAYPCDQWSK